jgi:hypothetical protein
MSLDHLSDGARKGLDLAVAGFAGVAAISLSQAALIVTIIAGLASILLAAIRVYDRITFGPKRD